MAERIPGAPGVNAAATTNARQSNATSLRAWIIRFRLYALAQRSL